jgi:hypothetical protein
LKTYLTHKLEHLHRRDATQRTILMAYLSEFYVMRLNQINPKKDKTTFDVLQQDFLKFLQDFKVKRDRRRRRVTYEGLREKDSEIER